MENQLENLTQKVQMIEETLHVIVKELAADYKKTSEQLKESNEQHGKYHKAINELLKIHGQNRQELEISQNINTSHFNAQDYIKEQTEVLKGIFQTGYEAFRQELNRIDKKIDEIPESYTVKNHHHIEPKSKGMLVIFVVLLLTSVFGSGWGIANHFEKRSLAINNIKYRMFRNQFPDLNQRIDSIFYKDPERAKMVISTLEAETELRKAAEQKRQEADVVAKEAERLQQNKKSSF